jgi:hypothetical protein
MSLRKARGRPFQAGNPGRPPGSKNRVTEIVAQLAEGEAEQLIQKTLELAKAGDVTCLRILLDRLWPPRKGQIVQFDAPPIKTSQDVLTAIVAIWDAIRVGRITPEEANALSSFIDRSLQATELQDVLKRIESLEQAQADEKKHASSS